MSHSDAATQQLGTEKIGKLIWKYSLPSIVGTIVMSLYNIVDRIFIGQGVGPLAISGIALSFPFMILLMAFGLLIGAGSAARISITMGENDKEKAAKILGNALTLSIVISGTVSILCYIFLTDLLGLFGGTPNTIAYAEEYMRVLIPGAVFSAINYGFNNIMRATGHPQKAMYTMIICAVLNAVLDALFIFGFGWGIEGAAIATNISYIVGSIWVLTHFMPGRNTLCFRWPNFKLQRKIVLSIVSIGLSPFSMQLATSLIVVLINSTLLRYGGDLAIGAYGIINSVNVLIIMMIIGLNQGTQPVIGYNYGAKKYDRMFKALKTAIIAGSAISIVGFLLGMFLPNTLVSFFTKDSTLKSISVNALQISVAMYPLIGFQIVVSNFFQSMGKAKISILLSLTRQFLFIIPCLLILPLFWGLSGAWMSMPVSDALSTIVCFFTIRYFIRNFKRTHKAELQTISNN